VRGNESKPHQFQTIAKGAFAIEISKLTQQALIFINRISSIFESFPNFHIPQPRAKNSFPGHKARPGKPWGAQAD
jgi:hypothetical protein